MGCTNESGANQISICNVWWMNDEISEWTLEKERRTKWVGFFFSFGSSDLAALETKNVRRPPSRDQNTRSSMIRIWTKNWDQSYKQSFLLWRCNSSGRASFKSSRVSASLLMWVRIPAAASGGRKTNRSKNKDNHICTICGRKTQIEDLKKV